MLLAHLLRERHGEDEDMGDEEEGMEGGGDRRLMRLLIGSQILRRQRVRRMLLAHLLRERREAA
jgi:hypothetical protein